MTENQQKAYTVLQVQTYTHIERNSFPQEVQEAIECICYDLGIQNWSGSVLRWVVSDKQIDVCPSDAAFDTAANILNNFLTICNNPVCGSGVTIYIDL